MCIIGIGGGLIVDTGCINDVPFQSGDIASVWGLPSALDVLIEFSVTNFGGRVAGGCLGNLDQRTSLPVSNRQFLSTAFVRFAMRIHGNRWWRGLMLRAGRSTRECRFSRVLSPMPPAWRVAQDVMPFEL